MRKLVLFVIFASARKYDRFEDLDLLFEDATGHAAFSVTVGRENQKSSKNQSESFEKLIRWLQQSRDETINQLRSHLYALKLR